MTPWTWRPDWRVGMLERLEWRTDVLPAQRGEEQRRSLRLGPRQQVEFGFTASGNDRRHLEAALYANGAGEWALPLWWDGLDLTAPLAQGASSIPLSTVLRQFAVGEWVLLQGPTSRDYELIEIASVGASIGLAEPTARAWPAGTIAYPARLARIDGEINLSRFTGDAAYARLRFECLHPADWTANAMPSYRGYPVLETVPDWSEDPRLNLARKTTTLDGDVGLVHVEDEAETPLALQSSRFLIATRPDIDVWRQRLYALRGRQGAIWVPTWSSDAGLLSPVANTDTTIDVAWAGITEFLFGDPNRRDLRIELTDGTVLYRRVIAAEVIDANTERLTIDAALGRNVQPDDVALAHWLVLMRQDADAAEMQWFSGDCIETSMSFRGFRHGH